MNLSGKEKVLAAACIVGVLLAGVLAARVAPLIGESPDYSTKELGQLHESALSQLFGAFRVGVSDLIWLKTDEYLHQGVSYVHKPESGGTEAGHAEAEEEHDHAHEEEQQPAQGGQRDSYTIEKALGWGAEHEHAHTAIPSASEDFRGILGDLERAVKPYADQHMEHARMEELVPWYRILTRVNPKHVRGYVMGAYLISTKVKNDQKALEFLQEGERNNPESPEIEEALGRLYYFRLQDPESSLKHLLEAERLYRAKPELTDDDKETLTNAYRLMAWIYGERKDVKEMARAIDAGLRLYPEDAPLLELKKKIK